MSQKLTFYFHIGQPKTGSSAIQAFLNYNREKLAREFFFTSLEATDFDE